MTYEQSQGTTWPLSDKISCYALRPSVSHDQIRGGQILKILDLDPCHFDGDLGWKFNM